MNPFAKSALIATLALHVLVPAQRLVAQEKASLFFEVIYWGAWMERPLKYRSSEGLKAVPLQNGAPTCYLYSGPSPIIFYRDEESDAATGELKPVPLLSMPFQSSWRRAALLVTPAPDGKLSARFIPLTRDAFPPNTAYLFNASGKRIKCRLAENSWEMDHESHKLVSLPERDSKTYLLAASEWHDTWQVMYSDSFLPMEGERRVIYFHTPPGQHGVAALSSVIPPDKLRFDASGKPIESPEVDPDFKPSDNPLGTADWVPQ